MRTVFAIACSAMLLLAGAAAAQSGAAGDAPTLHEQPPNGAGAAPPSLPNTGESLSDKLDRSDGVIKPPEGVDPEISTPPKDPNAGANMPVIRPQTVPQPQPK